MPEAYTAEAWNPKQASRLFIYGLPKSENGILCLFLPSCYLCLFCFWKKMPALYFSVPIYIHHCHSQGKRRFRGHLFHH